MNKPGLPVKRDLFFWLIVHFGVMLALFLSLAAGRRIGLDTDLLGLLPPSSVSYAGADRMVQERTSRNFVILAESAGFDRARAAAEALYRELERYSPQGMDKSAPLFEELNFFIDERAVEDFSAWLYEYRYMLMDPRSAAMLEEGRAAQLAEDALARSYGAFTLSGLDRLDGDPFLLTEGALQHLLNSPLLSGGGPSLRDGILSAELEGKHYVLVRGLLSKEGASVHGGGGVREIYRAAGETERRFNAESVQPEGPVRFVCSGVPFHSYESAAGAQNEVALLSGITMFLMLVLFLWIFRSPLPVLLIVFSVLVSIAFGLSAAFLVFGTLHVLTLVFGASLTGLCVDYSIHFLFHRRRGLEGSETRRLILKAILLSFISSVVCFTVFLFAPFDILRQFALFSAAGLSSSCMTVCWLFPSLPRAVSRKALAAPAFPHLSSRVKKAILAAAALASAGILFSGRQTLSVHNDLRSLYTITPKLLEWERIASSVLNYNSGGFYFLVSGKDLEETLEHEEAFLARLNGGMEGGANNRTGTFLGASLLLPSLHTQEKRYRAAAALLPLAEAQYEALGFPPEYAEALREQYRARQGQYALPSTLPPYASQVVSNLLVGEAGGRWYSLIMPLGTADRAALADLAAADEWVFFVVKTADISGELDTLTITMFKLLALAAFLIVLGLAAWYRNVRKVLRIACVPAFSVLVSMAVHILLGRAFTFFSASGFILVLGLGLDYMFYLIEDSARPSGTFTASSTAQGAVILSFITTALSFGALLFSSFVPVRLLALGIVPGLSAAFACAMLLREP